MTEQPEAAQRAELTSTLNFTADDLEANREGRLSAAQQERLRQASRRTLIIGIFGIVVIGLGAAILIFLGQQNNSMILTLIGIALTIINAGIVGLLVQNRLRMQNDLTQPIRVQESIVSRTLRIAGRTPTYILRIDNENVFVNKRVFNAFIDGAVYRLYRSAGSKTLLAAELVGMVDE